MARANRKTGGERLRLIAERMDLLFAHVSDAYYLSDRTGTFVGVETEGQLEFLRERGCDEYQGFLFSPAVPADEFEKLLKARATGAKQAGVRGGRPSPS